MLKLIFFAAVMVLVFGGAQWLRRQHKQNPVQTDANTKHTPEAAEVVDTRACPACGVYVAAEDIQCPACGQALK